MFFPSIIALVADANFQIPNINTAYDQQEDISHQYSRNIWLTAKTAICKCIELSFGKNPFQRRNNKSQEVNQ